GRGQVGEGQAMAVEGANVYLVGGDRDLVEVDPGQRPIADDEGFRGDLDRAGLTIDPGVEGGHRSAGHAQFDDGTDGQHLVIGTKGGDDPGVVTPGVNG